MHIQVHEIALTIFPFFTSSQFSKTDKSRADKVRGKNKNQNPNVPSVVDEVGTSVVVEVVVLVLVLVLVEEVVIRSQAPVVRSLRNP